MTVPRAGAAPGDIEGSPKVILKATCKNTINPAPTQDGSGASELKVQKILFGQLQTIQPSQGSQLTLILQLTVTSHEYQGATALNPEG